MRIEITNTTAIIRDLDLPSLQKLRVEMSVPAPGAKYIASHKKFLLTKGREGWDGKTSLVMPSGTFLAGMVPAVSSLYKLNPGQLTDSRVVRQLSNLQLSSIELRDYQRDGILQALGNTWGGMWWPRGVLKCATGAGKTRMAAAMIDTVRLPTLFLVHRRDLLKQTIRSFEEQGIMDIGVFSGEKRDKDRLVTVATIQSLHSQSKRNPGSLGFLADIDQMILDEAHLAAANLTKGNIFVDVCNLLPNAFMRWGLTATPGKRDIYSNQLLTGVTGQVIFEKTNAELIEEDYLQQPTIIMEHSQKIRPIKSNKWQEVYEAGIIFNTPRNNRIIEWAKHVPKPGLIMVVSEAHGHYLAQQLTEKLGLEVPFIYGKVPVTTRVKLADQMRAGTLPLAVVSTVWDEGLDIPNLQALILAGGGKSFVKALQRIGRVLRKAPGKTQAVVVDFYDHAHHMLKNHSKERAKIWEEEFGHVRTSYKGL